MYLAAQRAARRQPVIAASHTSANRPVLEAGGPGLGRASALQALADVRADTTPAGVMQRKIDAAPLRGSAAAVMQLFDAGTGAGWHIHYGSHVKYDSNNATRVDFPGRTRRQIGYQWEQVIQANGLAHTKTSADFIACKTWIRNHIA